MLCPILRRDCYNSNTRQQDHVLETKKTIITPETRSLQRQYLALKVLVPQEYKCRGGQNYFLDTPTQSSPIRIRHPCFSPAEPTCICIIRARVYPAVQRDRHPTSLPFRIPTRPAPLIRPSAVTASHRITGTPVPHDPSIESHRNRVQHAWIVFEDSRQGEAPLG